MITAEQMRAARAILRMEQGSLAERAGVSIETVKRLERMTGALIERGAQHATVEKIKRALEDAGIDFVPAGNGVAAGVRPATNPLELIVEEISEGVSVAVKMGLEIELEKNADLFLNDPDTYIDKVLANAKVFLSGFFRSSVSLEPEGAGQLKRWAQHYMAAKRSSPSKPALVAEELGRRRSYSRVTKPKRE